MPPNRQRERQKILRKRTNVALHQSRQKEGVAPATNTAVAWALVKGSTVTKKTFSGAVGGMPNAVPYGAAPHVYPWTGLTPALPNYPFTNCAEAKMYSVLVADGYDPKNFTITTYSGKWKKNPPCANCKLWVYKTFKRVIDR